VVVGGGPAGSAVATFLGQRGLDVLLVDEARFPRDKVCGESVSPEAWRLIHRMEAEPAVRALEPQPIRGMALTSPHGISFRGEYRDRAGFALRRHDLDRALLHAARRAGVEVREGVRAASLIRDGETVTGLLLERRCPDGTAAGPPEACRARLVIGADGRRSVVARSLGLLREHPTWQKFAVRGYWEGMEGLREYGEMHVGGGGYCGVAPLSRTRANLAFVLDRRAMREAGGDLEAFYRASLRDRWPRLQERLARATLLEAPRAIGPLALQARRLSTAGALLVGDSAGFYDPFTGEGITLALRSAELAAEVVWPALGRASTGRDGTWRPLPAAPLREYDRLRHAATRDKFRFNRLLQRIVAWPGLADHVARRLARRPDLADALVGIAGDFVPARGAFNWSLLVQLLA
jgi:geranylgeranyl reductase family protein